MEVVEVGMENDRYMLQRLPTTDAKKTNRNNLLFDENKVHLVVFIFVVGVVDFLFVDVDVDSDVDVVVVIFRFEKPAVLIRW